MPNKTVMQELVKAHQNLEEPMSGAIWIRQDEPTAWLVEILPELPDDPTVLKPFVFTPSHDFRYSLHLIAGNLKSLKKALLLHPDIAYDIAHGEVLFDKEEASKKLLAAARKVIAQ